MRLSVGELTKLTGISIRTLHYYDEIGLLAPSETSEAGYRYYDDEAVMRLQQILFYRELDFPLSDIKRILSSPDYDRRRAMTEHRELLKLKRDRLDALIRLTDETLRGETTDMGLDKFNTSGVDAAKDQYAAEAEARWGKTEAYKQSARRTAGRSAEAEAAVQAEMDDLVKGFAGMLDKDPAAPEAQAQVKAWQAHITRHYYECSNAILAGLGEMYTADERFTANLDRYADGTAQFMREAIRLYCGGTAE